MRVVYYTHSHFFEPAISFSRAMCDRSDFHLLLELSPSSWQSALFDMQAVPLSAGIQPADPIIGHHFPVGVKEYWRNLSSFNLVVHTSRRSIYPTSWWTSHLAMRFIRRLRPDVLHLDDPDVSIRLALAIMEIGHIPLILNVHDPFPHSGEHGWRKTLARRLIFPRVNRFILHNDTQIDRFCQENNVAPERVSVIRLGSYDVYREWIAKPIMQDNRTILFFGRLSPYKGIEVLYDAAQRVAERIPSVRFVVAGKPQGNYLAPLPPVLKHGGHIELIDNYVSNARLAELFQLATVVACPYLDATQSGVVLTAYAFNCPVVVSAVGGLPEYVAPDKTGLLVAPDNPGELADALIKILLNPNLRSRFRDCIRSLKTERFNWRRVADETAAVYDYTRARSPLR